MTEPRIEQETRDGDTVWRKHYGNPGRRLRMALLRWLARRLGLNALLAPLPLQPEAACRTEAAMIARLAAVGVHVPQVLEQGERHLLLSDLGPTMALLCKREREQAARARLLQRGFEALLDLHARGGYASQAVARNLTFDGQRVGFIDLEEDPLQMMPLAAAQARDALLWVQSSARFLADSPQRYADLLAAYLEREAPEVRGEILKTARWLRWLAPPAALGGARGRAFAQALRQLARVRA